MSKFTTGVLAVSAIINSNKQKKILKYIDNNFSNEGEIAKKEFKRFNIITLLIVLLVLFPLCIHSVTSLINYIENPSYPNGATKKISGHISLYEDTFWYTNNSQKYEFAFEDYSVDNSYEPGEIINIYIDDNNNIVSISHQEENYGLFSNIILAIIIPTGVLLIHSFVGRKTYAKNWNLYVQWYEKEIEPYSYQSNFEEIVANKKFYDVTVNIKDLRIEEQQLYKKYRNRNIFYTLILLMCVVLTIYICIKFNLNPNSWLVMGIIGVYVLIFYILIDNCEVEMHRMKTGYYKRNLGYFCQNCKSEIKIKFEEMEKYDSLSRNEDGIRVINCPHCGNQVTFYDFDNALDDYKKYLEKTKTN